jgi:hypothetical protein
MGPGDKPRDDSSVCIGVERTPRVGAWEGEGYTKATKRLKEL